MVKKDLRTKIEAVLNEIRPMIESHGGQIKLILAKNNLVKIKVLGACVGCPMAQATFDQGIAGMIKERVPEIKKIEFVS